MLKSAVAAIAGWTFGSKALAQTETAFSFETREPRLMFEPFLLESGTSSCFPLDFGGERPRVFFTDMDGKHTRHLNDTAWVYVPEFDVGVGGTREECELMYRTKTNRYAADLLLAAAKENFIARGSRASIQASMHDAFGKNSRLGVFEYEGWLVGVDLNKAHNFLVNPRRQVLELWRELDRKLADDWYGWSTEGLCVLDASVVRCGKVD
jgi:hypothetical protein